MKVFLKILPVTLLAEVVRGQFCTKGTLDCSTAVPAIKKLGSHSCACGNEIHAGALKFDKGKLYVCLGKKWAPLMFKAKSEYAYGTHPENPGRSCNDILAKAGGQGLKNGVYWLRLEGSSAFGYESFKVYCDMESGPGGWTMVFKLNSARPNGSMTYHSLIHHHLPIGEERPMALSTNWNQGMTGYKSRIWRHDLWPAFSASRAKIVLYNQGKPKKQLLFNAESIAQPHAWFSSKRLLRTDWSDLDASFDVDANGGRFHYFIDGRFFYINKENSPNCDTSKGWLRVLDGDQPCEEYAFKKERIPGIFYSTQNTATLWTKGHPVGKAEVMIIYWQ